VFNEKRRAERRDARHEDETLQDGVSKDIAKAEMDVEIFRFETTTSGKYKKRYYAMYEMKCSRNCSGSGV
jgi:hypothetical protein